MGNQQSPGHFDEFGSDLDFDASLPVHTADAEDPAVRSLMRMPKRERIASILHNPDRAVAQRRMLTCLALEMSRGNSGLRLEDASYEGRSHTNSFSGYVFVKWLKSAKYAGSKAIAAQIAQKMLSAKLVTRVDPAAKASESARNAPQGSALQRAATMRLLGSFERNSQLLASAGSAASRSTEAIELPGGRAATVRVSQDLVKSTSPSGDTLFKSKHSTYHVKKILGVGQYGKVKLVVDAKTEKPYAMKVIKRPQAQQKKLRSKYDNAGPDPQQMIANEIAILKKMRHPNVVLLHEVIDDQNSPKLYVRHPASCSPRPCPLILTLTRACSPLLHLPPRLPASPPPRLPAFGV